MTLALLCQIPPVARFAAVTVAAVSLLLIPRSASAWPVDWTHDVAPASEKFLKLSGLDWFELEDPKVASLEWLDGANELLISGLAPGRTLALVGLQGRVAAWRIRIGGKGSEAAAGSSQWGAAKAACAVFEAAPLEDVKLRVHVQNSGCSDALLSLFRTDAYEARHVEMTFEPEVLQRQLARLASEFSKLPGAAVSARYVGAGLVLEGTATRAAYRKVLWTILENTLGPFALDDRIVVSGEGEMERRGELNRADREGSKVPVESARRSGSRARR
jgi:hypothetical protein